ncbi:hydroxysteroid 11-beta-dehydrogenase 1-like protein isoform X1 [Equus quagga]|uniref:hydroxysteroid 11-beta-dehydrogenase 1-like protein isoform X1 n=1 Tax=Equus quagga TaxID=89248 RepID=UPI001EE362C5|nr:hydroxysteroid 11-beta-dehydrogenase 1-like protein isoform X1 [Equus quagga]
MEVGETGVPVGQARAGHPLSRCRPGRAMRVLLLTGLGALFFAYYWDDNFNPASLQGARVLLTGASAGVGEELAYHYARLGSHLVLTAHTEALLQKVVGNCRKLGAPKIFYIAADMASPEVPERVVQFALDKLGGLDYLVLNHLGAAPAGTRARSAQATRWLLQAPPQGSRLRPLPLSVLGSSWAGDWQSPRPGELPELRAADFVGAAQPDGQQGLPGGGVLAARPRAHVLLQPLLGGQVRAGRLLRLPAAGAGRAGRERGHHHVRPRPPGPRLRRRGSQGRHEGQGGPGAQGGPGRDPRGRHARLGRLLPVALPPALPAPGMAAAPRGLVHPPGAQRHGRRRCCLSSCRGRPFIFPAKHPPSNRPGAGTPPRGWPRPKIVLETEEENREKLPAPGNSPLCARPLVRDWGGIASVFSAVIDDVIAASIVQM